MSSDVLLQQGVHQRPQQEEEPGPCTSPGTCTAQHPCSIPKVDSCTLKLPASVNIKPHYACHNSAPDKSLAIEKAGCASKARRGMSKTTAAMLMGSSPLVYVSEWWSCANTSDCTITRLMYLQKHDRSAATWGSQTPPPATTTTTPLEAGPTPGPSEPHSHHAALLHATNVDTFVCQC